MTGRPGRFVSFEGIDGAGKSTQIARAADHLRARGWSVVVTREPGGTPGAEAIRALLVEGGPERWSAETELLLFTAARRDHVERVVRPAISAGEIVLCDRYVDSTRAYQAAGRGASEALVDLLHAELIGLDPDLTLVLDLDPDAAAARRSARPEAAPDRAEDRFERFGSAFQARLRAAFRRLVADAPDRRRLIDAGGSADATADRVRAALEAVLPSPPPAADAPE